MLPVPSAPAACPSGIRPRSLWTIPALFAAWAAANPPGVGAQTDACRNGVIREVFIDNHSIFNTAEMEPGRRFRWVYSAANRLHRRTRRDFIENELLFAPGDCLDGLLLSESERILRSYDFIAEADVYPVEVGGEDVHVVVDTQDEWTTKVDLRADLDEGLRLTRLGLTEENLLGTGNLLGFFLRERDEQRDVGAELKAPRLGGTRLDGRITGGNTRTGTFFEESLAYPFVGEVGRYAFVQSVSRREDLFSYAPPVEASFKSAVLPVSTRRAEVTAAIRLGTPGDFTVVGGGISWEKSTFDFPSGLMVVPGDDFSVLEPADSATAAAIMPQTTPRRNTRLNVLLGKRNIRFITRRGLDAIRGEQDIRVGTQALVALGATLGSPSTTRDHVTSELWGRISLFGGAVGEDWVLNSEVTIEGARLFTASATPGSFRDVVAEFDAYFYWQPPSAPSHTFVAGLSASGGWDSSLPFQLTLGGQDAIRGYELEDFPSGHRLVMNLEDRMALDGPFDDLLDLGLTFFVDAGLGWAGDVPFGTDSGLQGAAGVGLRVGFPSGTSNLIRLDLAAPMRASGLSDLQLRVRMSELVSLLRGFGDRQIERSRGASPNAGIFSVQPNR